MKSRILFVDHNIDIAGGQKSLLALIDSIDRSKFDLLAAAPREASAFTEELTKRSIPVHDVGFQRRGVSRRNPVNRAAGALVNLLDAGASVARLALLCRRERIDLIHANSIGAALIAVLAGQLAPTKIAVRVRSGLAYSNHGVLDLIVLSGADVVLCNSYYVRETIAERLLGRSRAFRERILGKCHVIYNPIPWGAIRKARRTVKSSGKPTRLRNGAVNIGVVGRITERKQQHVAVDAMALLAADGVDAHLWFLGAPSPIDGGRYARDIERQVEARGLASHVTFAGFIDDILPWLAGLDIVLMPSIAEPLARAIFESQAMGALVIAADDAGNAELIIDNDNGLLFRPGDAGDLAAKIKLVLAPEKRRELEWRALMRAARIFAPANTVENEAALLREVAAPAPRGPGRSRPAPMIAKEFSGR